MVNSLEEEGEEKDGHLGLFNSASKVIGYEHKR